MIVAYYHQNIENKEAWNEAYKILAQDEEWNKEEKWLQHGAINLKVLHLWLG